MMAGVRGRNMLWDENEYECCVYCVKTGMVIIYTYMHNGMIIPKKNHIMLF